MRYLTQGTIHLRCLGKEWTLTVDAIPEYKITHRGKDYTVFVPEGLSNYDPLKTKERHYEARVCLGSTELSFSGSAELATIEMLKECAIHGTKVALEVELSHPDLAVIGATVPAPAANRA